MRISFEPMHINIVLVEPEIPNNTGNIGRLCVGANCTLHLIKPLGFEITENRLKRSGLDYWPHLDLVVHECYADWANSLTKPERCFFMTTHTDKSFYETKIEEGDYFVFGKESVGLGTEISRLNAKQCRKIPFTGHIRCFNLANAVAMVIGESLRQGHLK